MKPPAKSQEQHRDRGQEQHPLPAALAAPLQQRQRPAAVRGGGPLGTARPRPPVRPAGARVFACGGGADRLQQSGQRQREALRRVDRHAVVQARHRARRRGAAAQGTAVLAELDGADLEGLPARSSRRPGHQVVEAHLGRRGVPLLQQPGQPQIREPLHLLLRGLQSARVAPECGLCSLATRHGVVRRQRECLVRRVAGRVHLHAGHLPLDGGWPRGEVPEADHPDFADHVFEALLYEAGRSWRRTVKMKTEDLCELVGPSERPHVLAHPAVGELRDAPVGALGGRRAVGLGAQGPQLRDRGFGLRLRLCLEGRPLHGHRGQHAQLRAPSAHLGRPGLPRQLAVQLDGVREAAGDALRLHALHEAQQSLLLDRPRHAHLHRGPLRGPQEVHPRPALPAHGGRELLADRSQVGRVPDERAVHLVHACLPEALVG
mmetsp:Transcript_99336/g.259007  ORF Transcript_99336/g.259007 Transcript_99336/m.259007 type:complete len:433 (+) Transcript_99336:142-1440(+)